MPKVSYHKLPERVYRKLFSLLPEIIGACGSPSKADAFVDSLFSTPEKIMIAKRLAIMLMLAKKRSYVIISDKLKVSQSTIGKMAEIITHADKTFLEEFDNVAKSDAAKEFWNELGYKLETLIPPRYTNWSDWRSRKIQEKIENEEAF